MPRLPKNLIKRGSSFYFRSRVGGNDRRVSLGSNLQEAKRKALLLAAQGVVDEADVQDSDGMTLEEFSRRWLKEYVAQSRNKAGQDLAQKRLAKHTIPVLGQVQLVELTTTLLRGFRGELEAKKLAAFTVRHVLSDVRCLLRYAVEVNALTVSPFRSSVMPKIPEQAPRALTADELAQVIAHTPGEFQTAVRLAVLTGLRWGELLRLQWRHLVSGDPAHLVLDKTKSGRVRRVPLVPEAVEVLKAEKQRTTSVFVLPHRPEHTKFAVPMRKQLGFYWTFHQLRHTFACRWLDAGGSKEALQKMLGHSTIGMTERYGHLSDDAVFAEARSLFAEKRPVQAGTGVGTVAGTGSELVSSKTS